MVEQEGVRVRVQGRQREYTVRHAATVTAESAIERRAAVNGDVAAVQSQASVQNQLGEGKKAVPQRKPGGVSKADASVAVEELAVAERECAGAPIITASGIGKRDAHITQRRCGRRNMNSQRVITLGRASVGNIQNLADIVEVSTRDYNGAVRPRPAFKGPIVVHKYFTRVEQFDAGIAFNDKVMHRERVRDKVCQVTLKCV